jgi:hypothetical protein
VPLPAAPHTFGIESSRDLVNKLEWEIERLEAETEPPALIYMAFNCAVTAWHVADGCGRTLTEKSERLSAGGKNSDAIP